MAVLSVERLSTLLKEAKGAHAEYERRLGRRDEVWPEWYAQFLCGRIAATEGLSPVTLTGRFVELRPLRMEHLDALCAVGLDPALWRHTVSQITTRAELEAYVRTALDEQEAGRSLPFAILSLADGVIVGSTRYGNIDRFNRHVEIGWTWVAPRWQRTAINTEAKLLLLRHAFETLDCMRVEFKTDRLNEQSRTALQRIGAVEEGVFRRHILTQSGRWRDSVYFSILAEEWPAIRGTLEARL
jgi:RimJ/RimL family protein N-acetyltransferase